VPDLARADFGTGQHDDDFAADRRVFGIDQERPRGQNTESLAGRSYRMFDVESRFLRGIIGNHAAVAGFRIRWAVVGMVAFCAVFWVAVVYWLA